MPTTSNPGLFTPSPTSFTAADMRALVRMVFPAPGVLGTLSSLRAVETSPQSLGVRVSAGRAIVQDVRLTGDLDLYLVTSTASYVTIPLSTADPSNPRIDLIVVRQRSTEAGDGSTSTTIEAIAGTPAGSPVAPATPVGAFALAQVTVGAGATAVADASITDVRSFATSDLTLPGGGTQLTVGYNAYSWTLTSDDALPLNGHFQGQAGRQTWRATSAGTGNTVGRTGILRYPGSGSSPGTITLAGSMIFTTVAGTGISTIGLGLNSSLASSWGEGVGMVCDSTNGSVKFYTNTSAGIDLTAYSGGTQRGGTVSALAALTWYPWSMTIAANGDVEFTFNGATIFSGAGGVDLIDNSSSSSPAVGSGALTAVGNVYFGAPMTVTYS